MGSLKKKKGQDKKIIPLHPPSASLSKNNQTAVKKKQQPLQTIKELIKESPPSLNIHLLELLADPRENVREFIIKFLSSQEHSLPLELLVDKLKEPPWFRKTAILKIIANRKEILLLDSLAGLTNDPNTAVRCELARTLGALALPQALSLLSQLTKDANPYVRRTAERALAKASKIRFI